MKVRETGVAFYFVWLLFNALRAYPNDAKSIFSKVSLVFPRIKITFDKQLCSMLFA